MKKTLILSICFLCALLSCSKEPYNTEKEPVAEPFTGVVETGPDVDLGLKAHWAGYNIGASAPEQYGTYYAWGETAEKNSYLEANYTYFSPGTEISGENDVASAVMGYGYQMPSEQDVQELIDNCSFRFCSYNGVNGWVATSQVKGYEGKNLFFPAAGYAAGENVNYQGSYAVFWTKELIPDTNKRAKNAFFKDSSLNLNVPPKGVGGLVWCGYSVRAVRKFALALDSDEAKVNREVTSVTAHLTGNMKWTASISSPEASINPASGIGTADILITFPENDTEETKTYVLTISSQELSSPLVFTISHFGITPEFSIDGKTSENIEWNETSASCALKASSSVSWTARVTLDGQPVEGSAVSPSSGTGSAASVSVVLPFSSDMRNITAYSVDFTTSDSRIPQELATVSYIVYQSPTHYVPFSDSNVLMDEGFYTKLISECSGSTAPYILNKTVTVDNITVIPASTTTGLYIDASYFIYKKGTYTFTSASTGNAELVLFCAIRNGKKFILTWTDSEGNPKTVPSSVSAALTNTSGKDVYYKPGGTGLSLIIPDVEAGDVISIYSGDDGKNQRMYQFLWKEKVEL